MLVTSVLLCTTDTADSLVAETELGYLVEHLANNGGDAVAMWPLFKKRPTLRGEMSCTMPRFTTSAANSLGVQ